MPSLEDRKYKLSIYLIKESYEDDDQIIPKCGEMNPYDIDLGDGQTGKLYIKTGYRTEPKWAEFFRPVFNPRDIGLETRSSRAVLLVPVDGRIFCLTFGHAHFLIEPLAVERNFGLRVALNLGGENSLRVVDKTSLDVVEIQSKEQSSKEVSISNFDFDFEMDILKSIKARSEDGETTLSGRDAVSVSVAVRLDTLRDYLVELLEIFESEEYKEKFSWVDNITEERDKEVIEQLNYLLVANVTALDPSVWLSIPEIIIWEDIAGFAYKRRRNPVLRYDIHLDQWKEEIVQEDDVIDIDYLKRKKISLYDTDHQLYNQWPVYHCLNAEINIEGKKYIFTDGAWYQLNTDFVSEINDFYGSIEESAVDLPPFGAMKEPDYNEFVANENPADVFLMDRKMIVVDGKGKVEFCDLYTSDNKLIHVKKYGGSSVLSHLFQQGVVSGELFISDTDFREKVNHQLEGDFQFDDVEAKPNPAEYEVCYAIMSDIPGDLHIPFFSKVVLKNAVKRLQAYGYKVTKKKISIS